MLDVIAVGETMLAITPVDGDLASASVFRASSAGGESNVAANLAGLGHRAAWASRVGDDPQGRRILIELAAHGVDLSPVVIDPAAPTGLMLKDPAPGGSTVQYYRTGSAAAAMDRGFLDRAVLESTRVVHTTGVTAALSASCARMIDRLIDDAHDAGIEFSFDINYRPKLWGGGGAAAHLLAIGRRADLVFVGRDEAQTLWGTGTAEAVRKLLPEPPLLIVKDADVGATLFERDLPAVFVPAHVVEVIEPVGAGDAFSAGFLSGYLRGIHRSEALDLGHLAAARVLATVGDLPEINKLPQLARPSNLKGAG
ncbi:sugar kinase [Pseudarthrobacter sp. 1C304]|uniref:sugar kinase n=1 Tax=Pseudarthrobacter sp. 1C304 TaxID=3457438 RepID=UPI003FD5B23F